MGSKGGGSSRTYNTSLVSPQTRDFFEQFKGFTLGAGNFLEGLGPYSGRFVAKPDPRQREALRWMDTTARQRKAGGFGTEVYNLGRAQATGQYLRPQSNPFLKDYLKTGTDEITRAWSTGVLPQLRTGSAAVGADLGTRAALVESESARNLGATLSNFTNQALFENYAREREFQQAAGDIIGQGQQLMDIPSQQLFGVGETERGFQQEKLNNAIMQYMAQIQGALLPLQAYGPFAGWAPAFADSKIRVKS